MNVGKDKTSAAGLDPGGIAFAVVIAILVIGRVVVAPILKSRTMLLGWCSTELEHVSADHISKVVPSGVPLLLDCQKCFSTEPGVAVQHPVHALHHRCNRHLVLIIQAPLCHQVLDELACLGTLLDPWLPVDRGTVVGVLVNARDHFSSGERLVWIRLVQLEDLVREPFLAWQYRVVILGSELALLAHCLAGIAAVLVGELDRLAILAKAFECSQLPIVDTSIHAADLTDSGVGYCNSLRSRCTRINGSACGAWAPCDCCAVARYSDCDVGFFGDNDSRASAAQGSGGSVRSASNDSDCLGGSGRSVNIKSDCLGLDAPNVSNRGGSCGPGPGVLTSRSPGVLTSLGPGVMKNLGVHLSLGGEKILCSDTAGPDDCLGSGTRCLRLSLGASFLPSGGGSSSFLELCADGGGDTGADAGGNPGGGSGSGGRTADRRA